MKRGLLKKGIKRGPNFKKKKESVTIAVRKDISPESINRLRLIMRKLIILKRNENEGFKKSFN
jgi:hypothetical protein